ncbi:MAG: S-layer homology domain-containing protein [Anaerolineales bacterium]|nr:S-layer homology domain-containing protein [Anaerolineales bacterium]
MKKFSSATVLAILGAVLVFSIAFAVVGNGNFETGDYTGWTKSAFINNGYSSAPGAGGADLSTIVGGAAVTPLSLTDPRTNNVVKFPAYGHYSAKVNDETSYFGGGHAQNANTITQNVTAVLDVSDSLAHIRFAYSAVMAQPGPSNTPHTDEEKPYFRIQAINTSNGNDVVFDFSSYVGEPGKNWQTGAAYTGDGRPDENWMYLDWTYIDLASSAAHPVNAGDQITLIITAAGCSQGGHPGYVYVDEITDSSGNFAGPTIKATGPATGVAGGPITYTYTYHNGFAGPIDPTITITPPANVTFNSLGDPAHCSGLAPVTCNFTGVAGGASSSFTVSGTISAGAAPGSQLAHGEYYISAAGFPKVGGQTVFTNITAVVANLSVTATGASTVKPGTQYVYTFNYTTSATANNTQVIFTLPTHTTYVSSFGPSCSVASGVVTCNLGTISSNGSFTVTTNVDKLKKIGVSHTLPLTAYQIKATGITAKNGTAAVNATVVTPFADVNVGYWAINHIQSIWAAGVTSGCLASPLTYCPDTYMPRGEMAIYVEKSVHGSSYNPGTPALSFTDTSTHFARYWIEALKTDKITGGCTPTTYCPGNNVTRAQMAIFLLRGKFGSGHIPPAATGTVWVDVPLTYWAAPWTEELKALNISSGCGNGYFCPDNAITRAEMAILVQRTFQFPMPTP